MILIYLFAVPFVVAAVATPLAIGLSKRAKLAMDISEGDALKIHKQPTSLLGGVAIGVGIVAGICLLLSQWGDTSVLLLLAALAPVSLLGLFDDLRWKHISTIRPMLKFFWLIVCTVASGALAWYAGVGITGLAPWIAVALSAAYVFVYINAVNYQDGMDGLAGSLSLVSFIGFAVLGMQTGGLGAALPLAFAGASLGFLLFNMPPAKVFMGDMGAYLLGMCLAVLAMMATKLSAAGIIGPLLMTGMPLVDGVITNLRRVAAGKSIFHGDRSHFYDKLMQAGYSVRRTLGIAIALQIALVALGLLIYTYA